MNPSRDPTIDELLGDPLTRAVMKADRVDPAAFETMLRSLSSAIERRTGAAFAAEIASPDPWQDVATAAGAAAGRKVASALIDRACNFSARICGA